MYWDAAGGRGQRMTSTDVDTVSSVEAVSSGRGPRAVAYHTAWHELLCVMHMRTLCCGVGFKPRNVCYKYFASLTRDRRVPRRTSRRARSPHPRRPPSPPPQPASRNDTPRNRCLCTAAATISTTACACAAIVRHGYYTPCGSAGSPDDCNCTAPSLCRASHAVCHAHGGAIPERY